MLKQSLSIRSRWWLAGSAVAIAVALSVVSFTDAASKVPDKDALTTAKALSTTFADIAEVVSPSVVYIRVEKTVSQTTREFSQPEGFFGPEFFERFFEFRGPRGQVPSQPRPRIQSGQGSGFIIGENGYIVTNHHVVGGADRVVVTLADGREMDATVVGSDPQTDIAVIQVDYDDIPGLKFADSDELRVGEWVLAIGSPFGLEHSITSGIVSARGRARNGIGAIRYSDFIQTDAAINPGNSGGPLLNLDGEVVGMNTAIVSRNGAGAGIGFAIPSNMLTYIKDQIVQNGSVTRGLLGVRFTPLTSEMAEWFQLNDKNGVLVVQVEPGSPAENAGLERDDVIVEYDAREIRDANTFPAWVSTTPPGTTIDLKIIRDGKPRNVRVTLGSLDPEMVQAANPVRTEQRLGLSVQAMTPELAQQFGFEQMQGMVITQVDPGSVAAAAGLRPGMLIQEVTRIPVSNMSDFARSVEQTGGRSSVLLLVRDQVASRYVALRLP